MTTSAPRLPLSRSAGLPVVAPQRAKPGYQRAIEVGVRSVHLVSMGLVLGGIGMGGTHDALLGPIIATVVSGAVLLATSLFWGCLTLTQGAGWALLLKLALLGLGNVFPGARLFWYAAATIVSSVGSHMPSAWRHYSLPIKKFRLDGAPKTPPGPA